MAKAKTTTVQKENVTATRTAQPRADRPAIDYMSQNLFSLALLMLFIRTNPNGNAKYPGLDAAIDALLAIILSNKEVYDKVSGSNHFVLEDGEWKLTKQGQSLAMHRAKAMQSDKYRTSPLDFLFGTPSETEVKRPLGAVMNIWQAIVVEGAKYLADERENLSTDEQQDVVACFNDAHLEIARFVPQTADAEEVAEETAE